MGIIDPGRARIHSSCKKTFKIGQHHLAKSIEGVLDYKRRVSSSLGRLKVLAADKHGCELLGINILKL